MTLNKRIIDSDISFIPSKILYKYKIKNIQPKYEISIYFEIIRSLIIDNIIKLFTTEIWHFKDIISNLYKIFKYNKLNELVQKWCWLQYYNNTIQDAVIPYTKNNKYNYTDFISDFNYILNSKITEKHYIFIKLKSKVSHYLHKSYNLYQNLIQKKFNSNFKIIKSDDQVIFYISYDKSLNNLFNINNHNSEHSKIKISISSELYTQLYNKFIDTTKSNFSIKSKNILDDSLSLKSNNTNPDKYIFCLVFRYSYIDSGNQQLAINKKIKDMFKVYGVDFELFGSAINVVSKHYCSLFYDIEKYFGSKGNFFDIELYNGIYWCNPPYDDTLMTNTAKKIINILESTSNIAFILTIPIWDSITKKQNFKNITKNYNITKNDLNHNDYQIYALLKPYIKSELIIPKKRIPYFNYRLNTPIYAVDTYMLIVYKDIELKYIDPILNVFDEIIKLDKIDYFNVSV